MMLFDAIYTMLFLSLGDVIALQLDCLQCYFDQLKALVNERLKAAAEEIFRIFETTIQDYEEIVVRSKQEADQQRRKGKFPVNDRDTTQVNFSPQTCA